jgi:excisionase family DNA binding protein
MGNDQEWITTATAARLLGLTRVQVRYLIRKGVLQARKVDGRWLVSRSSVLSQSGRKR